MATRERGMERPPEEDGSAVPSLAPWSSSGPSLASAALTPASVSELLELTSNPGALEQLGKVLAQGAAHPRAELAEELVALLDRDAFKGLVTVEGTSLRALAVEAVVAQGYPEAMALRVEDVEHWRAQRGDASKLSPTVVRLTLLVVTFLSAASLTGSLHPSLLTVLGALVPLIALVTAFLRPGGRPSRTGLGALGVVELVLALAAWVGGAGTSTMLAPLLGLVVVAALLLAGPQDKPG